MNSGLRAVRFNPLQGTDCGTGPPDSNGGGCRAEGDYRGQASVSRALRVHDAEQRLLPRRPESAFQGGRSRVDSLSLEACAPVRADE